MLLDLCDRMYSGFFKNLKRILKRNLLRNSKGINERVPFKEQTFPFVFELVLFFQSEYEKNFYLFFEKYTFIALIRYSSKLI